MPPFAPLIQAVPDARIATTPPVLSLSHVKSRNSIDLLDIRSLIAILPDRETCITQTPLAVQRALGSHVHVAQRAMFVALSVVVT
jgi:hypothetical protein